MQRVRSSARRGDLASIHIAKARLGLDDGEYRDLMATVCSGVRSAAALDFSGRKRFLAHLQACLQAQDLASASRSEQRVVRKDLSEHQRLMWSLWMQLADAGLVAHRTMDALQAFAARQTGVDRIEWLNFHQESLVLASLKRWLKRARDAD